MIYMSDTCWRRFCVLHKWISQSTNLGNSSINTTLSVHQSMTLMPGSPEYMHVLFDQQQTHDDGITDTRLFWLQLPTVQQTTHPHGHWHQTFLITTTYCSTNNTPSDHWHQVFLITPTYCSTNNTPSVHWHQVFLTTTTYCSTNNTPSIHWHQAFLTTTTYCSTNNTPSIHWHQTFLITPTHCSTNNTPSTVSYTHLTLPTMPDV